ncbi:unnamed protein product [Thelazia callipaeda]|uniref:receptor protein-tyrosine kinase n=1 Tax=Thelazia callipaeda TaxID=103827 RepID=A0A158RBN5_THECL|nr:unnamed protein product [Thelazia callipaeda]
MLVPPQTEFRVPIGTKQFRLICPVKEKNDDPIMIQWKKNDEPIGLDFNNRFKLARLDRELKIRNPQLYDSGIYQCQAINGFGHREQNFTITFYDSTVEDDHNTDSTIILTTNASPPVWKNETEIRAWMLNPVRITVGGTLLLRCPAKGNPLPNITWLKDGKELEREVTNHYSSAILYLNDVQPTESGKYVCKLNNEYGSIEATFHVYVENFFEGLDGESWSIDQTKAQLYPVIDEPFNNTVRVGRTAQFHCKVKNQQQPLIKWLKRVEDPNAILRINANATLIHANNMHLLLLEKPETTTELSDGITLNRLIIPNVRHDHSGTYLCVVTNAHGDIAYRSVYLHVIAKSDNQLLNFYFYGGILLLVILFIMITYAIYFLRKNYQAAKNDERGITSTRCSFSLRPPPPNLPPPKAPALHSEHRQLMSSSPPCDRYTVNLAAPTTTHYLQFAIPDKNVQKIVSETSTRPTSIRRTNGSDGKYRIRDDYVGTANWLNNKMDSTEADLDQNFIAGTSMYGHNPPPFSYVSTDNFDRYQQKPFLIASSVQKK